MTEDLDRLDVLAAAELTPEQALVVALSVQAETMTMGEAQERAPAMLDHLRKMGYDLHPYTVGCAICRDLEAEDAARAADPGAAAAPSKWHHSPDAPPEHFCEDCDAAVRERDGAYRERNALVAALIRSHGWPAQVVMAPDTEGWWIVYAETPAGQVSWHISPNDMDLFSDWPVAFGSHHSPWDGHSTEEKYRRVAALHHKDGAT